MRIRNILKRVRAIMIRHLPAWVIKKRRSFSLLEEEKYYKRFGIIRRKNGQYAVEYGKIDLVNKAYEKAWEIRNFEIDKFWTRAAYFWGFIVLIFGGYMSALSSEHADEIQKIHLDLFLLCLGCLFSLAWWLSIRGSKCWQENWEKHIDKLEDYISGPIYKTVYYGNRRSYSVSKLNEVLAIIVMCVWGGLFIQTIRDRYTIGISNADWIATIAVIGTILFSIIMVFGYCLGEIYSKPLKGEQQGNQNKKLEGGFVDRYACQSSLATRAKQ